MPMKSFRLATKPDGSVGGPFTLILAVLLLFLLIGVIVNLLDGGA